MKLDELEVSKTLEAIEPPTRLTITHVSTIQTDSGQVMRQMELFPKVDPDFHLGAVSD